MAVTAQQSDYFDGTTKHTSAIHGRLRVAHVKHTQSGDGDANSTVDLWRTPSGKVQILAHLSEVTVSAFGAGRTLDIGHAGYTEPDGTVVAADENHLSSGKDVSSADTYVLSFHRLYESRAGVVVQAKVEGDTIPDAATIEAYIVYVID